LQLQGPEFRFQYWQKKKKKKTQGETKEDLPEEGAQNTWGRVTEEESGGLSGCVWRGAERGEVFRSVWETEGQMTTQHLMLGNWEPWKTLELRDGAEAVMIMTRKERLRWDLTPNGCLHSRRLGQTLHEAASKFQGRIGTMEAFTAVSSTHSY
jgi:hypothetical protein